MSNIVIAEPIQPTRRAMMKICRELGHQVHPVAVLYVEASTQPGIRPDVIITNFKPADQARSAIRQWRIKFPTARVIIVSATRLDLAKEAEDLDAFAYMREPFLISEFKSCIQRACGESDHDA